MEVASTFRTFLSTLTVTRMGQYFCPLFADICTTLLQHIRRVMFLSCVVLKTPKLSSKKLQKKNKKKYCILVG